MSIQPILRDLPFELDLAAQLAVLRRDQLLTLVNVGNSAAKSFLIQGLLDQSESHELPFTNVFWASTDEQADQLHPVAQLYFGENIKLIPAEFDYRSYYDILSTMQAPDKHLFLFEDLSNFLEHKLPTQKEIEAAQVTLTVGDKVRVYECFETLEAKGYRPAEDKVLQPGEFLRQGENLFIFPLNAEHCYRLEMFGDEIENIDIYAQAADGSVKPKPVKSVTVYPAEFDEDQLSTNFWELLDAKTDCFICDDLDTELQPKTKVHEVRFTTFPENDTVFFHLNFFNVLPFYTLSDFVMEVKERFRREFTVVTMTKKSEEMRNIFKENEIMFTTDLEDRTPSTVKLIEAGKGHALPHSWQNNDRGLLFLTDREIFQFRRSSRAKKAISGMNFDLINSLKPGDFVVHVDHGVARFDGIVRREVQEGVREYLKLSYAGSDKLFVPVESAEKVSKYVGDDNPRLTKLGGAEWQTLQRKLKEETERVAKELLKIYAARELAKGQKFTADDEMMREFYDSFPYELTPGQRQSWEDVRIDMEKTKPMDRLVCGDVGFGKTEIAMRACFKAFRSGKQAALLSPITILAEQHYQSFVKRVKDKNFGVRIELLSRFQTAQEQRKILKDLEFGLVDIVVGTHRLLSADVKFKNLGLVVIDEEQRFGVKQKEKLKAMRSDVDILTLTATPIPRTLHMGLNKLKDVSTITTPPPGRLPVVTEVRRYNLNLIRERILQEVERGGQVYFLHNEVKTIESQAEQMRSLMPNVRFIVAHGQMTPHQLEEQIRQFKEGEADVLVASTIIENGIDLPNANTLFVNKAEKFGLSQLYQLRGRVGRGRTQAYAFFLYQGQKLALDAKKRLRAIVEASELGAGFQIAMKDLEIRGAGEILGASQSGTMKDAGVSHFVRMLNKTMEEMRSGEISTEVEEQENITVEIPLSAYIPPSFIPSADEKIQVYQELASAENEKHLKDIKKDIVEDYGELPKEVENLCKVIRLKLLLREANLSAVRVHKVSHKAHEITLRMGKNFTPDQVFGLLKNAEEKWVITANAIKLTLDTLPVGWYAELCEAVGWMSSDTSRKK